MVNNVQMTNNYQLHLNLDQFRQHNRTITHIYCFNSTESIADLIII